MREFAFTLTVTFTALAVRSLLHWLRHPIDSTDPRDHALLALFVLTRVGAWLLLALWSWIGATLRDPDTGAVLQGRAVIDDLADRFLWIPALFVAALAVNVAAGWFLGRRGRFA
jgi:ABC-type dipeptide/oligopeptide/nickel transport system permease component